MKEEVVMCCDVNVKGDKNYKPFVEKAIGEFLEYVGCYYRLGFIKSIKVDVYFKEKKDK